MCLLMETPAKRADVLYNVKHAFSITALSPLRHFGEYMYIPCRETDTIRRNFFSQEFDWVVYHTHVDLHDLPFKIGFATEGTDMRCYQSMPYSYDCEAVWAQMRDVE
jgi:hypothetical protein